MWMLGLAAAHAQANTFNSQSWCFGSGLRVIFEEDHQRPEVRITTLIEGGSAGEAPSKGGVAHLVEHLWFRADAPGGGQVQDYQVARGVRANAYTTEDVTGFTTTGPKRAVSDLLRLESLRLSSPLAGTQSTFSIEKGIVRSELKERYTDASGSALHEIREAVYPDGHPYRHLPIGSPWTLDPLTREDAAAYVKKWYRPEHTTMYLSGDLDPDRVAGLLGRAFGPEQLLDPKTDAMMQTCTARQRPVPPPPAKHDPGTPIVIDGNTSARIGSLVWHIEEDAQKEVLSEFSLWMMERYIRSELQVSTSCRLERRKRASLAKCDILLKDDEDAAKRLRRAVRASKLAWEPSRRQQLAYSFTGYKRNFLVRLYQGLDRRGGEMVVDRFHETGEPDWLADQYDSRNIEDFSLVAKHANRTFTWEKATTFDIRPGEAIDTGGGALHSGRSIQVATSLDPKKVDQAFLSDILAEPNWSASKTYTLKNGMKAILLPFGNFDSSHVQLVFPFPGPEPKPGLNSVAWNSLPYPDNRFYTMTEEVLGRLSVFGARDGSWRYTVSGVRLLNQLSILKDVIEGQKVRDVAAVRRNVRDRDTSSPYGRARAARWAKLLPGLALTEAQLQSSVASMKAKEVKSWAENKLAPSNGTVVVVGQIEPTQVIGPISRTLGALKGTGATGKARERVEVEPPERTLLAVETQRPRSQASVTLACRIDGTDGMTATVVANLIEARASALRESRGLTYGVYASHTSDQAGRVLHIQSNIDKEGLKEGIVGLRGAVAMLSTIGPSDADLARARVVVAGEFADEFQRGSQLVSILGSYARAGRAPDEIGGFAERLMNVDKKAVQRALKTCVGHEVISVVTSGVEEALSQTGQDFTVVK